MGNFERTTLLVAALLCLAFGGAAAQYVEDYNGNGSVGVSDVIFLLTLARINPNNPRVDYNGDGKYTISDAIALLLNIRDGKLTPISEPTDSTKSPEIRMLTIAGGTFQMGSNSDEPDEKPAHTVRIDPFRMSVTEITNQQYADYLNDALADEEIAVAGDSVISTTGADSGKAYLAFSGTSNAQNQCWIDYEDGEFVVDPGKESWPVVYVSWYGASAFAAYYGYSLPTEAQWEYAARGGDRQYEYPTDDGTILTIDEEGEETANYNLANFGQSVGYPKTVGSYSPNPFGLEDMAGNVSEWCSDWYESTYYRNSPEDNPTGPDTGIHRVSRGGGWNVCYYSVRSANRSFHEPEYRISYLGFRVVDNR